MDNLSAILQVLGSGVPVLLLHFGTTVALLAVGVICYTQITPFRERELIVTGNVATGVLLGGTFVALAIPLAAILATSNVWLDIVIWGSLAVVLQLATFLCAVLLFRDLRSMIEAGNAAAASVLAGLQVAVALLNAGAMAG